MVIDETAIGRHDDVSEGRLHEIFQRMVTERFHESGCADDLLMSVVFKS